MSETLQESDFDAINGIEDIKTPFNTYLGGKYKKSLAYEVIKNKLPKILDEIIDSLNKNQEEILLTRTSSCTDELKQIVEGIKKLKNELMTNKPLVPLIPINGRKEDDSREWNKKLEHLLETQGEAPTWFNSVFFIAESYFYRRIAQEFFLTKQLKNYDPFCFQKRDIYFEAQRNISLICEHMMTLINTKCDNITSEEKNFTSLLKLNLWGNRSDLYLSSRSIVTHDSAEKLLQSLDQDILVDNSNEVWKLLHTNFHRQNKNVTIDIILDNAGYELFTDLCLAAYLIDKKLASKIRFYVKSYPWFISDVTTEDFHWLLKTMMETVENKNIQSFAHYCMELLNQGFWTIEEESFWTQPYNYQELTQTPSKDLYYKIANSLLVVIKGDLNYSKLLADFNWKYETEFNKALQSFKPTNVVCLRTIKSDVCVGLPVGKAEELSKEDFRWMYKGRFGLIQAFVIPPDV